MTFLVIVTTFWCPSDYHNTVAWKGHTLQFTAVTSTKQPSRLQNTRHVYKSTV